jgi:hypothetical protein
MIQREEYRRASRRARSQLEFRPFSFTADANQRLREYRDRSSMRFVVRCGAALFLFWYLPLLLVNSLLPNPQHRTFFSARVGDCLYPAPFLFTGG